MKKIPITKEGLVELKKKLHLLKNFDRKKIIESIKVAREYGDLKENAEYHAAKEEQF
ncbi:MAG TPA: GreA/GreB family elongation factor [Candidatus Azoamicus sp.]